jgi:antitoxin component YwqK of YwqJK toxin-antitoxin module
MKSFMLALLLAAPAWAIDDCFAGAKQIDLNNGASTTDYTGIVRCIDRDTNEETRSMTYSRGKLNGREKRKWPGGGSMEQEYRDGKRHGEYRKYENGKLVEVSHYVDDRELGETLRYSKTGKLIRKIDRREPDSASTWQNFDEAGRLTEAGCGLQSSWKAGLRDCKWSGPSPLVFFHPNGQKSAVIELRDGLRHGLTTTFDREGVKDGEERYAKGLRDGLFVDFENGKPRRSANYAAGEQAGEELEFFGDGSRKKVTVWKEREATKVTDYFQNGAKKFERVRDGQQVIESEFNDDGQLVERTQFDGRERAGPHERFLPDGGTQLRETFKDGDLQGRRQVFFDNGRPQEDSQWERGHVTARKRWDADGGLVEDEAFYEDGSRKKRQP